MTARLRGRGITVVEIARSRGVDLICGHGLAGALAGVDVVIDASDPTSSDESDLARTLATAYRNLVGACVSSEVQRLVALTISGIEDPVFDEFPYYVAKRVAKEIVRDGPVPATIVCSTQWHEFATHPAAVSETDDEVTVEDWLIQPVAADTIADVLVEAALGQSRAPRSITGPDRIRLPELTTQLLAARGDDRPVRAIQPPLPALAAGALLAPDRATVLGPDIDTWLRAQATDGAGARAATEVRRKQAAARDVSPV